MTTNDKLREALEVLEIVTPLVRGLYSPQNIALNRRIFALQVNLREALAASKQEPSIVLTNAYRADIDRAKRDDLEASKAIFSKQEPQSTMVDKQSTKHEPQAEPFQESNSDCKNRHQCWEPCGELGKSEAHVNVHVPQAQAGEPEVVAYALGDGLFDTPLDYEHSRLYGTGTPLITLQSHREAMVRLQAERNSCEQQADYWQGEAADFAVAIAKKDAALKACVEALQKSEPYRTCHEEAHEAAITQAQEAMR